MLFIIMFSLIIFIADSEDGMKIFSFVRNIPGGDKSGHFVVFALFAIVVNLFLDFRYVSIKKKKILLGSVIVFFIASIEELSQIWIPNRTFDLVDLFADSMGILLVSLLTKKRLGTDANND